MLGHYVTSADINSWPGGSLDCTPTSSKRLIGQLTPGDDNSSRLHGIVWRTDNNRCLYIVFAAIPVNKLERTYAYPQDSRHEQFIDASQRQNNPATVKLGPSTQLPMIQLKFLMLATQPAPYQAVCKSADSGYISGYLQARLDITLSPDRSHINMHCHHTTTSCTPNTTPNNLKESTKSRQESLGRCSTPWETTPCALGCRLLGLFLLCVLLLLQGDRLALDHLGVGQAPEGDAHLGAVVDWVQWVLSHPVYMQKQTMVSMCARELWNVRRMLCALNMRPGTVKTNNKQTTDQTEAHWLISKCMLFSLYGL